jgi:hypothetical protein
MVTFTKVIGVMTKRMARVFTLMLMALAMRASGKKISSMGSALKGGLMGLLTMAITPKEKNTVKENSPGLIIAHLMENSTITIFMVQAYMNGQMVGYSQASGRTTKWRAMAPLPGLMAENTWVNTLMT